MEERWISILLEQQGTWRILGIASRKEMRGLMKKRSQSSADPLERAGSRTQHRILNHWCHDRLSHTRNMPKPRKCFCLWHSLERGQKTCRKRRLERIETSVCRTRQDGSTREFTASVVSWTRAIRLAFQHGGQGAHKTHLWGATGRW